MEGATIKGVGRIAITGGRTATVNGETRFRLLLGGMIVSQIDPVGPDDWVGAEVEVEIQIKKTGNFPYKVGTIQDAVLNLSKLFEDEKVAD